MFYYHGYHGARVCLERRLSPSHMRGMFTTTLLASLPPLSRSNSLNTFRSSFLLFSSTLSLPANERGSERARRRRRNERALSASRNKKRRKGAFFTPPLFCYRFLPSFPSRSLGSSLTLGRFGRRRRRRRTLPSFFLRSAPLLPPPVYPFCRAPRQRVNLFLYPFLPSALHSRNLWLPHCQASKQAHSIPLSHFARDGGGGRRSR